MLAFAALDLKVLPKCLWITKRSALTLVATAKPRQTVIIAVLIAKAKQKLPTSSVAADMPVASI
jgi:hypothetical protein